MGDETLTVWVADSPQERAQGLMDVERLPSDIDGMLFVYDLAVSANFHMLETIIELDIWWFDEEGALVGLTVMEPCPGEPCVLYPSPGPIRWALETPRGRFTWPRGTVFATG